MSISIRCSLPSTERLHRACYFGDLKIVRTYKPRNAQEIGLLNDSETRARQSGQEVAQICFLRIGADIEVSYRDGVTALVMACYRGNEEMVQYLLSRRANIQTRCDTHATPLHVAALAGYASVAEMLLKRGADVNTVKENGQSALHSACKGGHQKVITTLLHYGADPLLVDYNLMTPLHYSCGLTSTTLDLVEIMVALGADVTAKDNGGETPLSWACLRGLNADVIEFLIKKGADVASIFPLSYRFPNRVLEILVHAGVEMPFLVAKAKYRIYEDLHELVEKGTMDCNQVDEKGLNALYYVCCDYNDGYDMAKLLLTHGCRVPVINDPYIQSPLHLMAIYSTVSMPQDVTSRLEMTKLLIDNGVDINSIWTDNITPQAFVRPQVCKITTALHLALISNFTPMVDLLLQAGTTYNHMITKRDEKETYSSVWQLCENNKKYLEKLGGKWTPENHRRHPACVKEAITCILLVHKRNNWGCDNNILYRIFDYLAYKWQS